MTRRIRRPCCPACGEPLPVPVPLSRAARRTDYYAARWDVLYLLDLSLCRLQKEGPEVIDRLARNLGLDPENDNEESVESDNYPTDNES